MGEKIAILLLTAEAPPEGDDPLLALLDGQDLMTRATRCACSTGNSVFVTIATNRMHLAKAIAREPVTIVPVPRKNTSMASALRAGIRSLPKRLDGAMVMLADIAALTGEDLGTLLTHFAELGAKRMVSATDESGHPGFPLVLPSRHFRPAARLGAGASILSLVKTRDVSLVRLDDGHARTDLSRPEAWVAWRAGVN